MREKHFFVYMITNERNTVLYVGVTSDLVKRMYQHKNKLIKGFSSRYNLTKLVYYEMIDSPLEAIKREKQVKNLLRKKKEIVINKMNPTWEDLYSKIIK